MSVGRNETRDEAATGHICSPCVCKAGGEEKGLERFETWNVLEENQTKGGEEREGESERERSGGGSMMKSSKKTQNRDCESYISKGLH